jgi:uncharacterized protein with NRDE domain
MCVVAVAIDCHPRWKLVLAGNRDEFHSRDADPLGYWEQAPHVIAGRDRQAGGGWLGVSSSGRLAVVTNIRNPDGPDPGKLSRGALVGHWLTDGFAPNFSDLLSYNPFNLLLYGEGQTSLYSNLPAPQRQTLEPGIHGLSNGHPGEPWPRRSTAEAALSDWMASGGIEADLFDMLRNENLLDDGGIPIFIRSASYGTRCSTVVLVGHDGYGRIEERRFGPDGEPTGSTGLEFHWPQP